nr:DnaT-like ssDNA-binding domain-containing protein [Pseudomonas sp. LJDD11]
MLPTWEPNPKTFPAALMQLGIPGIEVDRDQFLEFRSFWCASPDDHRTQAKWEHALASHLKRNLTQQAGRNTHGHNGSGQAQSGQRTGGQRKLSAVEQVHAAIAEREAREAAAGAAGQPLGEDDRDLRPPLDGEFWPSTES